MTYKELDIKGIFSLTEFDKMDKSDLGVGWYSFIASSSGVLMEKRADGTTRHALIGFLPEGADIEYYFRQPKHWFE